MFNSASNLLSPSGLSAEQINAVLANAGVLVGMGDEFLNVEREYGVNAIFGVAQAIEETGWGKSAIAVNKHNVFGITAYDSDPYGNASAFKDVPACIEYWGAFIKKYYLTPGAVYYVSPTPAGVARHWASDPDYANKLVKLMNQVATSAGASQEHAPENLSPVVNETAAEIYTVVSGDNMWDIARKHGMTLQQLEAMNPHAGHPGGNFSMIWPGDKLAINNAGEQQLENEE